MPRQLSLLARSAIFLLRRLAPLFFDRRYLRGRYFEQSNGGWVWVVRGIVFQRILGINRHVPWPISPRMAIASARNLEFHPDDLNNFQTFGCYFQNRDARIVLGRGTYIGPNVGIITSNHVPGNPEAHLPGEPVVLGERCWIGMNSVILPGVTLGDGTTVGAGSVVTKSFPEGQCVIAGVPARKLRDLRPIAHHDS